jgi:hypothetical protein
VKATLQGAVWKGKVFHGDGTFTNRWLGGVRAGTATTGVEPSWFDGQPALVVHYPPTAPVFGNTRDELVASKYKTREVVAELAKELR